MKRNITFILTLTYCLAFSQFNDEDNRFRDSVSKDAETKDTQNFSGGNPPGDDDLPISDYLPVLFIAAVVGAVYTVKKQKQLK